MCGLGGGWSVVCDLISSHKMESGFVTRSYVDCDTNSTRKWVTNSTYECLTNFTHGWVQLPLSVTKGSHVNANHVLWICHKLTLSLCVQDIQETQVLFEIYMKESDTNVNHVLWMTHELTLALCVQGHLGKPSSIWNIYEGVRHEFESRSVNDSRTHPRSMCAGHPGKPSSLGDESLFCVEHTSRSRMSAWLLEFVTFRPCISSWLMHLPDMSSEMNRFSAWNTFLPHLWVRVTSRVHTSRSYISSWLMHLSHISSSLTHVSDVSSWLIHGSNASQFVTHLPEISSGVTGWRRLIGSPKLQVIFHKRATKYRSLLRKMTYKDKGSYESSPPCMRQDLEIVWFCWD